MIGLDSSGTPKEGAHAEKVDYGHSKHYGQAALENRNILLMGAYNYTRQSTCCY